jgi:hypothetical protein
MGTELEEGTRKCWVERGNNVFGRTRAYVSMTRPSQAQAQDRFTKN